MLRPAIAIVALTGALSAAGCSAPLYLTNYFTVVPKLKGLAGTKVYLQPVTDLSKVDVDWKESTAAKVDFTYRALSPDQRAQREQQRDERAGAVNEDELPKLGWHRNLYGMPVRDVRSLTPPAAWLREAIAAELTAQGVEIVDEAGAADLAVAGTLRWVRVELFETKNLWADLVLDVRIGKPGEEPEPLRLHTRGKATAWTGAEEESYEALTRAEQQLEHLLMAAIHERATAGCECRCR